MRVIAGRFKGHRLVQFTADHIRPTTDRVKESIFSILAAQIPGARVLDLFAGTGSLGIEALSRGAGEVTCVDDNRKSQMILLQNLQKLKIQNEIQVVGKDVFRFLKGYSGPPYDLIFADPPFTQKLSHEVLQALATSSVMHDASMIIIESQKREHLEAQYQDLILLDQRDFGDKKVSFFKRQSRLQDGQGN